MSEKAHALGIPDRDLKRALQLVRYLRASALAENLDPRATSIAISFAYRVDQYLGGKRVGPRAMIQLDQIAVELFNQGKRRY